MHAFHFIPTFVCKKKRSEYLDEKFCKAINRYFLKHKEQLFQFGKFSNDSWAKQDFDTSLLLYPHNIFENPSILILLHCLDREINVRVYDCSLGKNELVFEQSEKTNIGEMELLDGKLGDKFYYGLINDKL